MALLHHDAAPPPSQTPLLDSLIELSDSSLNKMATDMFLGGGWDCSQGMGQVGPSTVGHPTPLVLRFFPSPQLRHVPL